MADQAYPTPEDLRQLLHYEPETGKLFWRERPVEMFTSDWNVEAVWKSWNTRFAGKRAIDTPDRHGHLRGCVGGKMCGAGRVVWALVHGEWPTGEIDHINGVRDDNRIENLRDVSRVENHRNRKTPKSNKSGVAGVWWTGAKWAVSIGHRSLGRFADFGEAVRVRQEALIAEGYHANHGRRGAQLS
jgi:hypothetical protein